MESIYTELALYGSKNECASTDTVFLPISEVCDGTVSLFTLVPGSASQEDSKRDCLVYGNYLPALI